MLALGLIACGQRGVTDASQRLPLDSTSTTPPDRTVQRATITVRVTVDSADRRIADLTGLSLEGLTVRLARAGASAPAQTGVTDATGTARFDNLIEGQYTASVERRLSTVELGRLPESDQESAVLAGGGSLLLSPPAASSILVSLAASRRGSLIVSEYYLYLENPTPYNWGGYVEIYNNGDTTAYLDGFVLAQTSWLRMHTGSHAPCEDPLYRPYRHDPRRLWVESGIRFPGLGREFPVPPGEARVYAMDAVDHRVAASAGTQEDLRRAHFEHVGTDADVDNPVAQNVRSVFSTGNGSGGRGMRPGMPGAFVLVAPQGFDTRDSVVLPPVNPTPPGGVPRTPQTLWGLAREYVTDVMAVDYHPDYRSFLASTTFRFQMCLPFLAPEFDRGPAELADSRKPLAVRRRSLGVGATGREILMRTGTSARDLEFTAQRLSRSLNR